ncbi:uncharacterized protein TNCV_1377781 [Trichonephila clavipes]|nr:uncharacterized protein TNCV_1377781 [Trichonephila clavipes]
MGQIVVTCMVLKATAFDRRQLALCHDEFRGPRSDLCRSEVAWEMEHNAIEGTNIHETGVSLVEDVIFLNYFKGFTLSVHAEIVNEFLRHCCPFSANQSSGIVDGGFWQPVLCKVNDAQTYLQTEGLNIHQCAKKICALRTVLESKREEFMNDALIYAESLCEELGISFEFPRRIRRKHIFGDGSKDVHLSYEDDLKRTMFSSIDRVTAENRERFQQLQNLAQKNNKFFFKA